MAENKWISVGINPETHKGIKDYCDERGLKITFQIDKVLTDFLSQVDKSTPPQL